MKRAQWKNCKAQIERKKISKKQNCKISRKIEKIIQKKK